jgi:hypothetical protein
MSCLQPLGICKVHIFKYRPTHSESAKNIKSYLQGHVGQVQ